MQPPLTLFIAMSAFGPTHLSTSPSPPQCRRTSWMPHKGLFIKDIPTEGEGGWPKSRHSKGGCVDLVLEIRPKCGQGEGGGPKSQKFCGRTLWMPPPLRGMEQMTEQRASLAAASASCFEFFLWRSPVRSALALLNYARRRLLRCPLSLARWKMEDWRGFPTRLRLLKFPILILKGSLARPPSIPTLCSFLKSCLRCILCPRVVSAIGCS